MIKLQVPVLVKTGIRVLSDFNPYYDQPSTLALRIELELEV